jgi:DNA-binding CsgD family transcriptional regulator
MDSAERCADEAVELTAGLSLRMTHAWASQARALVDAYLGHVEAARSAAEAVLAEGRRGAVGPIIQAGASVLGFLELSLGRMDRVDEHLGPMTAFLTQVGLGEPNEYRFLVDEVEALIDLGRRDEARELLEPFEERGRALGRRWAQTAGARCRGLLRAADGDLDAAVDALDDSVAGFEALGMPFELGRSVLAKGRVHRRRRERGQARRCLSRANDVFDQLGARLWVEKTRAELARLGARVSSSSDLTPTESRVAELAASGMTNREVAERLFISPKTVEANLARIYRKLGIRSRAELGRRWEPRRSRHREAPDSTRSPGR